MQIPEDIIARVMMTGMITENHIHDLLANGVAADDDTLTLEKNVPRDNTDALNGVFSSKWGHDGICYCQ